MAQVLRKAVLPKNVSMLKSIKGRNLTTAANRKGPVPLSSVDPCRNLMENAQHHENAKMELTKQLPVVNGCCGSHKVVLRYCMSCPNLGSEKITKPRQPIKDFSPLRILPVSYDSIHRHEKSYASPYSSPCSPSLLQSGIAQVTSKRSYSKSSEGSCPCPFPCGPCGCPNGCGCLPPPCNQPPRCVQYMTGYYYYPYGYWFCGPYHVAGTCTPVGPCAPPPPAPPSCKCAPACVCPAATAIVSAQSPTTPKASPKGNTYPNSKINSPIRDTAQQPRAGIAKFFPYNTSIAPSVNVPNKTSTKNPPVPPMPPMMSSLICGYSTQAQTHDPVGNDAAVNINRIANSKFSTDERISKPISKVSANAFARSWPDYNNMKSKTPIHHKRSRRYYSELCPPLNKPKVIMTREDRDKPRVRPGAFDYASVPHYRSPYPLPHNVGFNEYES